MKPPTSTASPGVDRLLLLDPERRRRRDPDERHHHADVDDVAAVAAAVLADEVRERARRRLAHERLARARAAVELGDDRRQHERGEREADHRVVVVIAGGEDGDAGHEPDRERRREAPPEIARARPPPGDHRPDAGHEEQRQAERRVHLVEEGRPDGDLDAAHRLRDHREHRAPEGRERDPDQQQVVEEEGRLAREERIDLVLAAQQRSAHEHQDERRPRSPAPGSRRRRGRAPTG